MKVPTLPNRGLANERWFEFSFNEQMANIGAEVGRTINWKEKNNKFAKVAFDRALELLFLTKADPKNQIRLKELCRVNKHLVDWYGGSKEYSSTDADWEKYFYAFNYACRVNLD